MIEAGEVAAAYAIVVAPTGHERVTIREAVHTLLFDNRHGSAIRDLLDRTADQTRRYLPKIYSRELVETIFVHPYCRISDLVEAGIAKRQSASVYLKALRDRGILREVEGGREKLYTNPALLTLLSDGGR